MLRNEDTSSNAAIILLEWRGWDFPQVGCFESPVFELNILPEVIRRV